METEPALPPELISHILSLLPVDEQSTVTTLLACTRVSSSFAAVALHDSLWTPLARQRWKRGSPLTLPSHSYYKKRALLDAESRSTVLEMAGAGENRLPLVERVRAAGEDVIEVLSGTWDDPELHLTANYWATETRHGVYRDLAIATWKSIQYAEVEEEDAFERGAHAFAAFRGADPAETLINYDMDQHGPLLDAARTALTGDAALKHIAQETCRYMLGLGLRPAAGGEFHYIDNHFLNLVWRAASNTRRGTLPMSLVVIFCSLIRRLPASFDVQARPIGFPGVLLAGLAHRGKDDWIYINVFTGGKVLSMGDLERMASQMGQTLRPEFLRPASAKEICVRIARNILTSVRADGQPHPTDPLAATASLYAVASSLFILAPPDPITTYANWIVQLAQAEFASDVSFLEREVVPTFVSPVMREDVVEICDAIRSEDEGDSVVVRSRVENRIRWRLGHVFRHRLFGYVAVVRGWDATCQAGEEWIQGMQVDTLQYGRHQPFFHVITEDGSGRYVASENITADDSVPESSHRKLAKVNLVGRYFRKRERKEDGRWGFACSEEVRKQYPDG